MKWLPIMWSNLWRRKTRSVLTMMSVLATFILFGLLGSFRNAVATYGDDYANALVVQSRNVRLPYSHVTELRAMQGIAAACGVLVAPVRLPSEKRTMVQAVDDPAVFEVHPGMGVSPQAIAAWREDRTAVLISEAVAKENGWRVSDRFMLPGPTRGPGFQRPDGRNALEIVVAGVFTSRNTVAAQGIFAHYEYVRDLLGAERAGMEYIAVRLEKGEDVDVFRSPIDAMFVNSGAPVKTYSARALLRGFYGSYRELAKLSVVVLAISALSRNPQSQVQVLPEREHQSRLFAQAIERIRLLAFGLAVLLAVGAIVASVNAMSAAVVARQRAVATLRALGFTPFATAAAVFLEGMLLGLLGGALGAVFAFAAADGYGLSLLNGATRTPFPLSAVVTARSVMQGMALATVITAIATIPPCISISRIRVAHALANRGAA